MKLYRHLRVCLVLAASLFLASQPAWATKRVALVIGNSSYQNVPLLPNPANDAAAIAATLKGAGFDVVDSRLNLAASDMRRALKILPIKRGMPTLPWFTMQVTASRSTGRTI